jgi:YD repeat-containing protein
MSIEKPEILGDQSELNIKVDYDQNDKTLSITDTGVGMTKQEII